MSKVMKGRALIIAISEFRSQPGDSEERLNERKGVKKDTKRLFQILSKVGYKVSLHLDVSAREIREIYRKESKLPQGECFISILSSHGKEGIIYDFYGKPILLKDLYDILEPHNSPQMRGVPKLFFIQACRGTEFDKGVIIKTDGVGHQLKDYCVEQFEGVQTETDSVPCVQDTFTHIWHLPSDTAVVFASSEGYVAFQNLLGSVFLQTLCDLLEGEERNLELNQIFTRLAYFVAYKFESNGQYGGYKEMPCYITNLTREVHPFRQT
ncbi:caspase-7-like [Rhinophrynus dorsalis]